MQTPEEDASPRFSKKTLDQMKACTKAEFPICLREAVTKMFGEDGKRKLDSVLMYDQSIRPLIQSPRDVWNLYGKYMERVSTVLGKDVAQVLEFESMKQIESMRCTECPLRSMKPAKK